MTKRLNGNLKWIVALIGLATILAGAVASHQIIGSDVAAMKPKVDAHQTYIDGDRIATEYIQRDISEIRITQQTILEEVRALK